MKILETYGNAELLIPEYKAGKKQFTIKLTLDQIHTIGNALNTEAKSYDELIEEAAGPAHSLNVWREKADRNRALTCLLLDQKDNQ